METAPPRHDAAEARRRRGTTTHGLRLLAFGPVRCQEEVRVLTDFFKVITAGPLFFVSAWMLMIFAGIVDKDVGIHPFSYLTAMLVTIGLWLAVAPAIGAVARVPKGRRQKS